MSTQHQKVTTSRAIAPADDADVVTVQGDIAGPATAERVIAAAVERFGRIDRAPESRRSTTMTEPGLPGGHGKGQVRGPRAGVKRSCGAG